MTRKGFYAELEYVLGLDPDSIKGEEALENFEGWDSVGKVSFMGMAYAELDIDVPTEDVLACKTVADLVSLFDGIIVE